MATTMTLSTSLSTKSLLLVGRGSGGLVSANSSFYNSASSPGREGDGEGEDYDTSQRLRRHRSSPQDVPLPAPSVRKAPKRRAKVVAEWLSAASAWMAAQGSLAYRRSSSLSGAYRWYFNRPATQYNIRFYNGLLSCYEVRTDNPHLSDFNSKRVGSLPPSCARIEIIGEATLGLDVVFDVLKAFSPTAFRLKTSNPEIARQFMDFWEATWPTLHALTVLTVVPPHPSSCALFRNLTSLHMHAPGNSQILADVMSLPNALQSLKLRGLLDVPSLRRSLGSAHCHLSKISLLDTTCLSEALFILYHCDTLRILELDGAQPKHIEQITDLVEAGKFPELTELVVPERNLELLRPCFDALKRRVREKRESIVIIAGGAFV